MGKLEFFEIVFDRQNVTFRAGEILSGHILLVVKETIRPANIYVQFVGEGVTNWMNKTSEQTFSTKHSYLQETISLTSQLNGVTQMDSGGLLPPGRYKLSFTLRLPLNCPSSYVGDFGSIQYCSTAVIEKRKNSGTQLSLIKHLGSSSYVTEAKFHVVASVDLQLHSYSQTPVEFQDSEAISCCCISSGTLSAMVKLPRTGYVVGQTIPISATVRNSTLSTRVPKVSAKLMQTIRCYGQSEFLEQEEIKEVCLLIATLDKGPVQKGKTQIWTPDSDAIPLDSPLILPTQTDVAVNISYKLILEVCKGPVVEIPILIASHSGFTPPRKLMTDV